MVGSVGAAAGVVVGESGMDVRGETDVVACGGRGTLQNVDASLVFGHPNVKATSMPTCWDTERAETTNTRHTHGSLRDVPGGESLQNPRCSCNRAGMAEQEAWYGWPAEPKLVQRRTGPPARRLRRFGAASFACIPERRMVDQTGIEPVTS
jgi:hypothetical protein